MTIGNVARLRAALAAAILALGLPACSGTSSAQSAYGPGDPSLAAANPGGGPIDPFLTNGSSVLKALDAIAERSGKPLRVTSINADRMNGLTVDVQEPKRHVNVDQFVIAPDGMLSGPTPVKLTSLTGRAITAADVDAQAFDPKAIRFSRLTQTAREAIAKSGFSDARVVQWEFSGLGADDRKYMYLEAARGRPVAVINRDLTIVNMQY